MQKINLKKIEEPEYKKIKALLEMKDDLGLKISDLVKITKRSIASITLVQRSEDYEDMCRINRAYAEASARRRGGKEQTPEPEQTATPTVVRLSNDQFNSIVALLRAIEHAVK